MTTEIIKSSSPRMPHPAEYSNIIERIERAARENAEFIARRKRERLWRRIAWASGILFVAVVAWRLWQ